MQKIKLKQVVLVEGKYDKVKLDAILEAVVIPVHGFNIFNDLELRELIKKMAAEKGIIVIMDSDAAGFKIRGFIRGLIPKSQLTDVYIPDVLGKEKRKQIASKEGKLGVEGIDVQTLRRVFAEAGISEENCEQSEPITKQDFILMGLSGGENSAEKRAKLWAKLDLPQRLTTKAALPLLNSMMNRDEFLAMLE